MSDMADPLQLQLRREREARAARRELLEKAQERAVGNLVSATRLRAVSHPPALRRVAENERTGMLASRSQLEQLAVAILREGLSNRDLEPFRLQMAYRITRALLLIGGRCEPSDLLVETLPRVDDWLEPIRHIQIPNRVRTQLGALVLAVDYLSKSVPVPVWPHPADEFQLKQNFENMLTILSRAMRLESGGDAAPASGVLGLHDLRKNWPSPFELVEFEQQWLYVVYESIVDCGVAPTRRRLLIKDLGLTVWEADGVIARAKRRARFLAQERDIEVDRELQMARLEHTQAHAREAVNIAASLQASKQIATVSGVNRHEVVDADADFMQLSKRLDAELDGRGPSDAIDASYRKIG